MADAGHMGAVTTLATDSADGPAARMQERTESVRSEAAARLRRLINDHYDFVWRTLRRLGVSETDAEDLAQEVFVSVSKRVDDVEPGRERGFLYRTAQHHASHSRRSRRRRREVGDEALDEHPASTPSPEELVAGAREKRRFYAVLEGLELDLREVFMLYELERFTMLEIAELLQIPAGTVASRLRRARAQFLELAKNANSEGGG